MRSQSSAPPRRADVVADWLSDRVVERMEPLLDRVEQLLDERDAQPPPLIDATAAANLLGIERKSLYRLVARGEIPVIRIGRGPRPRLRFDPRALAERRDGGPMPPDAAR